MKNNSGSKASSYPDFSSPEAVRRLFPVVPTSSTLLIGCRRPDYSASRIARAVEDVDAHILNLNVTSDSVSGEDIVVELRIDHRNPVSAAGSLQRYGYEVIDMAGDLEDVADDNRRRVEEFLRYLDV